MRRAWAVLLLVVPAILATGAVEAHGIGEYYATPIPLSYYLAGAGYSVAASFVILTMIAHSAGRRTVRIRRFEVPSLPAVILVVRLLLGVLIAVFIAAGFGDPEESIVILVPWFFWVLLLVGLTALSLAAGNVWDRINPWRSLVDAILRLGPSYRRSLASEWIGPAALFLLFWWELVSRTSFLPSAVSFVLLGYTGITIVGGLLFENWFRSADPLSVMFRLIGSISPVRIGEADRSIEIVGWSTPLVATIPLVVAMGVLLGGASFDSLQETVMWFDWLRLVGLDQFDSIVWGTGGLLLVAGFFVASYGIAVFVMAHLVHRGSEWTSLLLPFAWSLMPVIAGYSIAHNFPLSMLVLPYLARVLADPISLGGDMFGTAPLTTRLFVSARTVWFVEIALVVLGHVGGVWLAHRTASGIFRQRALVRRSQLPMAGLMVGYTTLTLWLLAQPLVVSP